MTATPTRQARAILSKPPSGKREQALPELCPSHEIPYARLLDTALFIVILFGYPVAQIPHTIQWTQFNWRIA